MAKTLDRMSRRLASIGAAMCWVLLVNLPISSRTKGDPLMVQNEDSSLLSTTPPTSHLFRHTSTPSIFFTDHATTTGSREVEEKKDE